MLFTVLLGSLFWNMFRSIHVFKKSIALATIKLISLFFFCYIIQSCWPWENFPVFIVGLPTAFTDVLPPLSISANVSTIEVWQSPPGAYLFSMAFNDRPFFFKHFKDNSNFLNDIKFFQDRVCIKWHFLQCDKKVKFSLGNYRNFYEIIKPLAS